ncbi:MAG: hypothetical protein ACI9TP_001485, partial [Candidatus Azotimanducaceae bacterium]
HGGCGLNSYDVVRSHAMSLALNQQGYAGWSLEYRRIGDVGGAGRVHLRTLLPVSTRWHYGTIAVSIH